MQQQQQEGGEQKEQQNQDQRLKAAEQQNQQNQQPHRCPRCQSTNTKFCYYNNYSLSQPRYFCKACRRYWTQGGTLRNIPVGGGCRKGKRAKVGSSSASASRTVQPQPPQKEQDMQNNMGIGGGSVGMSKANPSGGLAIHHQYYPGSSHGYLSSFAGLQSLSQSQPFNVGGGHDPASNMSLLQGFNLSVPMVALQPQQREQFFQMGGSRSNDPLDQAALYPSEHDQWAPHSVVNRSSVNPSSAAAASDSALWTMGNNNLIITTTTTTTTTTSSSGGPSLNPKQWPDLPGSYGSPN